MVFRPPCALNNEHWGNVKGGVPPLTGVQRGLCPLRPMPFVVSVTPLMQSGGQLRHLPCCETRYRECSWCQHAVGLFCMPQLQSKEVVLRSNWRLLSPSKQVDKSSFPCRKRSQVWDRGSEWWPKYMQQLLEWEKQAQSSKG